MAIIDKFRNFGRGRTSKLETISEQAKNEMVESLENMDNFDLYSIDIHELGESSVSKKGDIMKFKDGVVEEDEIGKFVVINGKKCREYQPGITGFVYETIGDRYHFGEWLKIGFCDNGKFKKSIIIEESGRPKTSEIPLMDSELLGGPFYEIKDNPEKYFDKLKEKHGKISEKEEIFGRISWEDLYSVSYKRTKDNPLNYDEYKYAEGVSGADDEGRYLLIDGIKFYDFKPGASGYVFHEFVSQLSNTPCIFLAEYKDGKMVGEGIILKGPRNGGKAVVRN